MDTVNGMLENVLDKEVDVLEVPGWSNCPHVINAGADMAIDRSSSKSANSSRYTLSAFSKSCPTDIPPDPLVVLHISEVAVVVAGFDYN